MRRTPALMAVIAFLVPACSGGLSPSQAVARAADRTADVGSARIFFEGSSEIQTATGPGRVTFTGEGVADYDAERARIILDMSELFEQQGTRPAGANEVETIFSDFALYVRAPFIAEALPGAKPWLKIDYREAAEEQGVDLSQFTQLGQQDPTQQLQFLKGATGDVEQVGSEEVRGVGTNHYEVTVDLEKVAELAPEPSRSQLEQLMATTGKKEMPFELWVDGEGLTRRLSYSFQVPLEAGGAGTMKFLMELYDFGLDVDVHPPPGDQVTDLLQLIHEQGAVDEGATAP